jgi:hypothetical protein
MPGRGRLPLFHDGSGLVRLEAHLLDERVGQRLAPSPKRGLETWA